ncbi:uncharacterized [Tachysurus ichikawai]
MVHMNGSINQGIERQFVIIANLFSEQYLIEALVEKGFKCRLIPSSSCSRGSELHSIFSYISRLLFNRQELLTNVLAIVDVIENSSVHFLKVAM